MQIVERGHERMPERWKAILTEPQKNAKEGKCYDL